jgi:hypothetical protein
MTNLHCDAEIVYVNDILTLMVPDMQFQALHAIITAHYMDVHKILPGQPSGINK